MKYSKLQYLLWLISGSEISVLEKCPNEYNRHANIGLMIFVTSLFAAFTSFIAGYTFAPDNVSGVSLFALSWAILIFSIDRSMVNSIKRDPNATEQPFWTFFIPRLILAFILAFFMSIPLDHIIFKERIKKQMIDNNIADWTTKTKQYTDGYNVNRHEKELSKNEAIANELEQELSGECPTIEYGTVKDEYIKEKGNADAYYKKYVTQKNKASGLYVNLPENALTGRKIITNEYRNLISQRDEAHRTYKRSIQLSEKLDDSLTKINQEWRAEKKGSLATMKSTVIDDAKKLRSIKDTIQNKSETYQSELERMNGFDTQFVTLFLMPDWGVQFLKWLIFLALLVIEILPTYLKLKTPLGQYEKKMQEGEDMMTHEIAINLQSEKEIKEQTESHRVVVETIMNKSIYDKIAEIELRIAEATLSKWEQQAQAQIDNGTIEAAGE